jgi:transposase
LGGAQRRLDGIKRHILLDTTATSIAAHVTAAHVTAAHVQDRAAFTTLLNKARRVAPTITKIWADKGYTGPAVATACEKAETELDIISGPKPAGRFIAQPRRWVVERTNGWINPSRRLIRQYETTHAAHQAFLTLSQIALLLRRLDPDQLFDTL